MSDIGGGSSSDDESPNHHIISELLAGHEPGNRSPPRDSEKWRNWLRILAAIALVCSGIAGLFESKAGNVIFSLVSSILIFLSIVPDDVTSFPRRVAGIVVNTTALDLYRVTVSRTRYAFQYGDSFVRACLMVLAIGGTATICKLGIKNFDMLPPYADLAVKRLGLELALACCLILPASLMSKRIFTLSMHTKDFVVRRYEFRFYVSVILFSVTVLAFGAGFPMEDHIPTHDGKPPATMGSYSEDTLRIVACVALIWLVWALGTGACIVSRFYEWTWRDRILNYLGPPKE